MAYKQRGRGKDHYWQPVKYKGDMAIYAKCSCGFRYGCYNTEGVRTEFAPEKCYPYCPLCGAKKKWYKESIIRIDKYSFEE